MNGTRAVLTRRVGETCRQMVDNLAHVGRGHDKTPAERAGLDRYAFVPDSMVQRANQLANYPAQYRCEGRVGNDMQCRECGALFK